MQKPLERILEARLEADSHKNYQNEEFAFNSLHTKELTFFERPSTRTTIVLCDSSSGTTGWYGLQSGCRGCGSIKKECPTDSDKNWWDLWVSRTQWKKQLQKILEEKISRELLGVMKYEVKAREQPQIWPHLHKPMTEEISSGNWWHHWCFSEENSWTWATWNNCHQTWSCSFGNNLERA